MKNKYKILLFGAFPILLFFTVKVVGKSLHTDKTKIKSTNFHIPAEDHNVKNTTQAPPFVLTRNLNP